MQILCDFSDLVYMNIVSLCLILDYCKNVWETVEYLKF